MRKCIRPAASLVFGLTTSSNLVGRWYDTCKLIAVNAALNGFQCAVREHKKMSHLKNFCLLTVATGSLIAGTAAAQGQDNNYYSRGKYEAVMDRSQPAFDPDPIRLGAFVVNATGIVGATYNSNVYAQNNNKKSDVIARIGGEVQANTDWSVHQVGFDLAAFRNEYLDLSDESANEMRGALHGRLDVTRWFSLGGRVYAEKAVEQRYEPASIGSLEKPVEYTVAGAEVQANYANDRFRWTNSVGLADRNYKDGRQVGTGLEIDQDFRDRQSTTGRTRLSYAVSPNLAVYGQATAHDESFDNLQLIGGALRSRDSQGYTVSGGVNFELAALVRGDIAVGYMNEDKQDNYFKDVDGLSVDGQMQWFPTRLTTVSFNAGRRVVDVGAYDSPSAIATDFGVRVDHELHRNFIISGEAGYSGLDYQEISRTDDQFTYGVYGLYKMNKNVHIQAFARHLDRDSSGLAGSVIPSYGIDMVGVELRLHP